LAQLASPALAQNEKGKTPWVYGFVFVCMCETFLRSSRYDFYLTVKEEEKKEKKKSPEMET